VIWLEVGVVLLLIVFNGALAMAEMSVVSSNRHRLKMRADRGSRGARMALALAEDPGRFLSTVQIGITLVGVLAGAFGGATLSGHLAVVLDRIPAIEPYGEVVAMFVVVVSITFLSIVAGELVPKQLALRNPEPVAAAVALPMSWLLRLAGPAVTVLQFSSQRLIALFGDQAAGGQAITEEEVKAVIHEGARAGVLKDLEKEMLGGVMRLADRRAELIMTEREHFATVELDAPPAALRAQLRASPHTRLVALSGQPPRVVGVLDKGEVLARLLDGEPADFASVLVTPPRVTPTQPATVVLDSLRAGGVHVLFVVDDADEVIGLITAADILDTIIPGFAARGAEQGTIVRRDEDEWLVDGDLLIDELVDRLGFLTLPDDRSFDSVAGFMLWHLEHLPLEGEEVRADGFVFEVLDMDGPRIDKVLVRRLGIEAALEDALDSG
jgi:putative hemolysin